MDSIFVYTSFSNSYRMKEISAVRFGTSVNKRSVKGAFTSKIENDFKSIYKCIQDNILNDNEKYVVVTHTAEIHRSVIRNECESIKEVELFSGRAWIDIAQLGWPLLVNGQISSRTIESLTKYFKVETQINDNADTCTVIAQIYAHMMRSYKIALAGEAIVRDIGGDTLEGLRKIVGF